MGYTKTTYVNGATPAINYLNLNNNENATSQIDFGTAVTSGSSNTMTITTEHPTMSRIPLDVTVDVSGGAITINRNAAGAKPLEEYDGTAITSLDAGFYDIVERSGEYVLMSGGGIIYNTPMAERVDSFNVASVNTYEDILNISGSKGELNEFLIIETGTGDGLVRVTVDGVVKFVSTFQTNIAGLVQKSSTVSNDVSDHAIIHPEVVGSAPNVENINKWESYPVTVDPGSSTICILSSPIPFSNSLQIEVQHSSTSADIGYYIGGAYKL